MKTAELLMNLTNYINQSPENSTAEVVIRQADGLCYQIARGDDARAPGQLYLVLVPDFNGNKIGMLEGKLQ